MFLLSDNAKDRRNKIISFLDSEETAIAVLLSAANFEWTLRRVIIALGTSKTSNFKVKNGIFDGCHGLKNYKKIWKTEVFPNANKNLAEIIPDWQYFKEKAFPLRHKLIHGAGGPPGKSYGRDRVMAMINASDALIEFASSKGINIFKRIKVRRKPRNSMAA